MQGKLALRQVLPGSFVAGLSVAVALVPYQFLEAQATSGSNSPANWAVFLALYVPIFIGGVVWSKMVTPELRAWRGGVGSLAATLVTVGLSYLLLFKTGLLSLAPSNLIYLVIVLAAGLVGPLWGLVVFGRVWPSGLSPIRVGLGAGTGALVLSVTYIIASEPKWPWVTAAVPLAYLAFGAALVMGLSGFVRPPRQRTPDSMARTGT